MRHSWRHLTVRSFSSLSPPFICPGPERQLPFQLCPRGRLVEHAHRGDGGHGPRPTHLVDAGRGPVAQGQPAVLGHRHHPRRAAARVDPLTRIGDLYFGLSRSILDLQCGWRVAASGGTRYRGSVSRGALDGDTLIATGDSCAKGSQHHPVNCCLATPVCIIDWMVVDLGLCERVG